MSKPTILARPTIYNGIKMRSRLEATFAANLDRLGVSGWQYEPQAYGSELGQYLPDFVVPYCDYDGWAFIEVRPRLVVGPAERIKAPREDPFQILDEMRPVWASEPDAQLLVASPSLRGFMLAADPSSVGPFGDICGHRTAYFHTDEDEGNQFGFAATDDAPAFSIAEAILAGTLGLIDWNAWKP